MPIKFGCFLTSSWPLFKIFRCARAKCARFTKSDVILAGMVGHAPLRGWAWLLGGMLGTLRGPCGLGVMCMACARGPWGAAVVALRAKVPSECPGLTLSGSNGVPPLVLGSGLLGGGCLPPPPESLRSAWIFGRAQARVQRFHTLLPLPFFPLLSSFFSFLPSFFPFGLVTIHPHGSDIPPVCGSDLCDPPCPSVCLACEPDFQSDHA